MYKLLATSALVAAGLWGAMDTASAQQAKPGFPWATSPISVVVGGYHNQMFGYATNKDNVVYSGNGMTTTAAGRKPNRTTQQSDSEIWFGGRTTLANGISIGFDVQLEANHSGDVIDESYLFIDGGFGRLVLGSENTADYIMNYSIPTIGAVLGLNAQESSVTGYVIRPNGVTILDTMQSGKGSGGGGSALPSGGNDQQRVTYYTPRVAGFGAGLSFTPNVTQNNSTTAFEDTMGVADKSRDRTNAWSGSVNYTNNFGGIQVNASVGGSVYPTLANATTAPGSEKIVDTSYGLQLGYGAFMVGGGYRKLDAQGASEDGTAWGVGGTWNSGPVSVGLSYMESKAAGTVTTVGDDKFKQGILTGAYNLGPGIDLIGAIFNVKYQDETSAVANNNSGGGAVAGVTLRF